LQEYQVAYVIIKTGNAPRPGTWALEKSVDGGKTLPHGSILQQITVIV